MKTLTRILFLLLPFTALSQNPQLTSLYPASFQAQSEPTPLHLTINGKNMWPDNLTISMAREVMHVHFKRDGRDVIMPRSTIGSSSYTLYFSSPGWADRPGKIEIYVTIDAFSDFPAYRSNSLFLDILPVPTAAPVLTKLSKSTFKTGEPRENYMIRLSGKNFGESASTHVTVGGIRAGVGWWDLKDGVIDLWIPSEVYNKAGEYPVVLTTKYGTSNALPLKIESSVMTVKPVTIQAKPSNQVNAIKPPANTIIKANAAIVNRDNASRLNLEMLRGVRVTMIGVVKDASLSAQLENFITGLDNIFVVDNQLHLSDNPGNININLKALDVDATAVDQLISRIEAKAKELKVTVSVMKVP